MPTFSNICPSYMVMPFVAQDLGHIMKKKQLTSKVIIYLFYQILRGLKVCLIHIHSNSFILLYFRFTNFLIIPLIDDIET